MRPLVSPEQMQAADRATIEAGTPVAVLMERAGRAVARATLEVAGGRYKKRAVAVCGSGSNGGDGFVAARVLAREGMGVRCLFVGDLGRISGAALEMKDALEGAGIAVRPFDAGLLDADVVIDALFGTGFHGAAQGDAAAAIEAMDACPAPVVAVDIPSGVDGTTGRVEGAAVRAAVTIAMGAEKFGTAVTPGASFAGRVEVADIGIGITDVSVWISEAPDAAAVLPRRPFDSHKRSQGSVAILGGSDGMSGAPILTARGAVRMGAGYATLGLTAAVDQIASSLLPEVLSAVVSDHDVLGPEALKRFAPVLEKADALALGPGLGTGEDQRALVDEALGTIDLPVVLDADGLNVLAADTSPLSRRGAPTVITPHPGELGRLLDRPAAAIQNDRLGVAREAARALGCIVLLKGSRTVVAHPDGRAVVNPTGGPELATAGTGDVLSGVVAALVAAGLDPFEAAWAGAFVHGLAGRIAGHGAIAWDVAEALPAAVGALPSS